MAARAPKVKISCTSSTPPHLTTPMTPHKIYRIALALTAFRPILTAVQRKTTVITC
jgi:hypothetical protein